MAQPSDRLFRRIYQRVVRDRSFFESIVPAEYKTLYNLLEEREPRVRLASGLYHHFDPYELKLLADMLPWYVHRLVRLPWIFTYRRETWGGRYYLKGPDNWAARALNYLLAGDIAREKWVLTVDEMYRLLRGFKSLIIVFIEVKIEAGSKVAGHGIEEA
jgi:uncharacterized protein (UPF0216 family)